MEVLKTRLKNVYNFARSRKWYKEYVTIDLSWSGRFGKEKKYLTFAWIQTPNPPHRSLVPEIFRLLVLNCLMKFSFSTYSQLQHEWELSNLQCPLRALSRDSSVSIATRYGLDGPGIESRWGRDFPHPFRHKMTDTNSKFCFYLWNH